MTEVIDLYNRALQAVGTRTTLVAGQIATPTTNEAKQLNLCYENLRDDLLRMAPWDCALKTANLTYITSSPGTPENSSPATPLWQPGQPSPPWAYEYQYPWDCLRACWVIPAQQTGYAGGVPITTAVTGGASSTWLGQPIRFKVQTDEFYPVIAAAPTNGGSGYKAGEIITLPSTMQGNAPIGAPVQLLVTNVIGGSINTVSVIPVINGSNPPLGGSYFGLQIGDIPQASSTGVGIGAIFNLTQGVKGSQRVILTNEEFATLVYCKQVIDPNVFDTLFQSALTNALGAQVCVALTGDKAKAKDLEGLVNNSINLARSIDGNEGLTINDVTPDWLRIRGIAWTDGAQTGPYSGFEWGNMWSYA